MGGFIKVVKNKAYFKRFQVKFKRRRQCKTDYYARRRLIVQDKNKYQTPKYRFVVRITNKDIVCQIFSSDMTHDVCLAAAYAHELKRYGITLGLTNYAAAYATGLLLARRVNDKLKLDYVGQEEVDGEDFNVEADPEGKRPFKAFMDVGLARTTQSGKEYNADPETVKSYIFGGNVQEYMEALLEDDEEAYKKQFSRYIAAGIEADDLEDLYSEAHSGIRADPFKKRAANEFGRFQTREGAKPEPVKKQWNMTKLSVKQRMGRVKQKLTAKGLKKVTN